MSSQSPITLFTPYFAARTPERQAELDACLERNISCREIARIVLLVDDGHPPPTEDPKVQIVALDCRPTYKQWVMLSQSMPHKGISVLANSDIYFDHSIGKLPELFECPQAFMALSRYEKLGTTLSAHPNPEWSQDVWAFDTSNSLASGLIDALNIPLGVPRCDNKIAYLFAVHGWKLFNPQVEICSVHVHETQQRHYDKKTDLTVIGSVAYVNPTASLMTPSTVDIDVWALNGAAIRSVKVNRSLDNWMAEATKAAPRAAVSEMTVSVLASPPMSASHEAVLPYRGGPDVPTTAEKHRFITQGERVFDHLRRFSAYRLGADLLALDWLNPESARVLRGAAGDGVQAQVAPALLAALFVPPVFDTRPIIVRNRPVGSDDCQFWQYPCSTEKQAYDNHCEIAGRANVDQLTHTVNTYLGLPWATYIDKKCFPQEAIGRLAPRIGRLALLAESLGYRLAVHTVCQQIYWRRLIDQFRALHVTDLHISHAERSLDPVEVGWKLSIHSWPLIAPNVEDPARRAGLIVGKRIEQKRYFASFIGAHMPHYRSDVRIRLLEAARASGRDDVLVDLGNEWHFNKVVYKQQVQHKRLTVAEDETQKAANRRYNEVLSDSVFSLCPEGAGPNTLRLWESLAVGSIPVILADGWAAPAPVAGQPDLNECCIFYPVERIERLFQHLAALPVHRVAEMQAQCIAAYAHVRQRTAFKI